MREAHSLVAMTMLADADTRRRGLREITAAHSTGELVMRSWVFMQGYEKGLELGRAAFEKGYEIGRLITLRQVIEVALTTRALKLTAARRAQIAAETRVEVLQRWLTRAITAERTAQVFASR